MPNNPNSLNDLEQELIHCRLCPRLTNWREQVALTKRRAYVGWSYWGKPVPGFGDPAAKILVVGLAPGAHGSNRTGRMFTGDASGEFLYAALHKAGFANQSVSSTRDDGLQLKGVFITAVARCCPPANKPLPLEIANCRPFLLEEMRLINNIKGVVALGGIAFTEVLGIFRQKGYSHETIPFGHHVFVKSIPGQPWLLASYHPSRQNTHRTVGLLKRCLTKSGKQPAP